MGKLSGGKKKQPSSRPGGWLAAGISVPMELTCKQADYARRTVGISRFVYNLAAATHQFYRRSRLHWPTAHEMAREFNAAKQQDYPFVSEVSKFVAQGAFRNFSNALTRWRNPEIRSGAPKFHKKRRTGKGSFLAASGVACVKYDGHRRIRLPCLGSVKLARKLPDGIPYEVTIRRRDGQWLGSISYWKPPISLPERETQSIGGVDVGIAPLAVDSDGKEYPNPKAYYQAERRLRRWHRSLSRRTPGSRGCAEAQRRIDKLDRRIRGLRSDAHHRASRELVHKFAVLGIETLNVAGMDKLRFQAKDIRDAGIGGLLGKVRYKADWCGTRIIEASQWFPSSKTCSDCGTLNPDLDRQPKWACPACGVMHDRNHNAARNLRKLALGAVSADVTLPDGKALARRLTAGETAPVDGRPKQSAMAL